MSYSERIGPGVVVLSEQLDDDTRTLADALMHEGFTVLVPELDASDPARAQRVAVAAIEYLVDNWHPRIGIVAFGRTVEMARTIADLRVPDATALFETHTEVDVADLAEDFAYDLS